MDDIKDFGANIVVLDMIGTNYDENQQLDEILRCKNGVKYIFLIDSKQKKEAMLKIESSRVPDEYIEYNKKPEAFFEELAQYV